MTLSFAQEQKVQYVISILQKRDRGLSILQINEPIIRQAVQRGKSAQEIVTALFRPTKES